MTIRTLWDERQEEKARQEILKELDILIAPNRAQIDASLRRLEGINERAMTLLSIVQLAIGALMADKKDVINEIAGLRDMARLDQQNDQQAVDRLAEGIRKLKSKVAELQLTTDQTAAFDEIINEIAGVKSLIKAVVIPSDVEADAPVPDAPVPDVANPTDTTDTTGSTGSPVPPLTPVTPPDEE